jgi:hypothetical protein
MAHPERTVHAAQRMQQRGISETLLRLIETFGEARYQKGGAEILEIREDDLKQLRQAIDRARNICLVKGEQDRVVTVMHRDRRIKATQLIA